MRNHTSVLFPLAAIVALPVLARPPRLDFGRVATFSVGKSGAKEYHLQSLAGCAIAFTYQRGIPVREDPDSLPIKEAVSVRCHFFRNAEGKEKSSRRVPWRDLKAFLLRPCVGQGKGESFFLGSVVVNAGQHHRRELRFGNAEDLGPEGQGLPFANSGANLPQGPILILGRLDESLSSISNRLEPHLVVSQWVALTP